MELLSRHFWSGGYDGHGQRVRIKKRGGGRRETTWTAQSEQALSDPGVHGGLIITEREPEESCTVQ